MNTVFFYTYDDPRVKSTPCPYKLLIGRENGVSTIKNVSEDADLKNIVAVKKANQLKDISFNYSGTAQSFKMTFKWMKKMEAPCMSVIIGESPKIKNYVK